MMVLVGGATRLTESGLSIVEWKPVTGTLPPLSEAQWTQAFEAYKTIPQYRELNAGMSLAEFKTIFWWEWSHRLLGRVIGVAYLLPFLWFLWRGALGRELKRRLWLIFGLGALQGAVGWWMVASGLSQRVEVSQYRLAIHLMLALVIFAAIVWTLRRLAERPPLVVAGAAADHRGGAAGADLRADLSSARWSRGCAPAGSTTPGRRSTARLIPSAARLWFETPWWRNLFDNHLTVQFEHRMTGLCAVGAGDRCMRSTRCGRGQGRPRSGALWLAAAMTLQAALGILTLLLRGADRSGAGASGGRDRGADARRAAGRAAVAARLSFGRRASAPGGRGRRAGTDAISQPQAWGGRTGSLAPFPA